MKKKMSIKKINQNRKTKKHLGGSHSKDLLLNPIYNNYRLTPDQKSTITAKMQNIYHHSILVNINNDEYITDHFRDPHHKMIYIIYQFLQANNKTKILSSETKINISFDLYHLLLQILLKKSEHFRSSSKSETGSLGSSTNDLSIASVLSNKDTITFRKISPDEDTQDIPLYTIV